MRGAIILVSIDPIRSLMDLKFLIQKNMRNYCQWNQIYEYYWFEWTVVLSYFTEEPESENVRKKDWEDTSPKLKQSMLFSSNPIYYETKHEVS